MGILAWSTNLERKISFPWQFVGLLLALVFGGITIYTEFVRVAEPQLQFEVLSNEPVLDVREKLPDLEVFYQSQDIAKSGKTLSVLLVRAANRGSTDILSSFYDSNAPIEIGISGGTLVKADISEASNDYLRRTVALSKKGENEILSPVIIEKNEWYTVKILALHDIDTQPNFIAFGKIAGQRDLNVVKIDQAASKEGFWHSVFSGGILVQAARIPSYFFASICAALAVAIPSSLISGQINKYRRKRVVSIFKRISSPKLNITEHDERIFSRYIMSGIKPLTRRISIIADEDLMNARIEAYLQSKSERQTSNDDGEVVGFMVGSHGIDTDGSIYRRYDMEELLDSGLVKETEGKWSVIPDRLKVLASFIEHVETISGA